MTDDTEITPANFREKALAAGAAPKLLRPEAEIDAMRAEVEARRAFAADLDHVLEALRSLLIEKNAAYGDSALNPLRLFSEADPIEQLKVRIDDKVSRIVRGAALRGNDGEDPVDDWLGYLVLLKIARHRAAEAVRATSGLAETPL